MANGSQQLALEIQIKTIADAQGITTTTDQIKSLSKELEKTGKTSVGDISARLKQLGSEAQNAKAPIEQLGNTTKKSVDEIAKAFAAANTKTGEYGRTISTLSGDQLQQLENKLRKEISTTQALGQSTTELQRKLDETTNAQKRLTPATENTSRSLHELGKGYNEGAQAGRVLSEVAQGNVSQIGQLGSAIKTLGLLLKTNFIAAVFTIGAVAIQALIPIISALNERFGKTKKTAEEIAEAFNAAEAAGAAFGQAKLDKISQALDAIKTKAEAARAVFRELLELQGKRDEVIAAAKNAQIDANPKLTASQKTQQKAAVDQDLIAAQRKREDALRQDRLDESSAKVEFGKQGLSAAENERADQQGKITAATEAKQAKEQLKLDLDAAKSKLLFESSLAGENPSAEQQQRISEASKSVQDKTTALKNSPSDEQLGKAIKDAEGELAKFELAVQSATKVLSELKAADAVVQKAEPQKAAIVADTRKAEDVKRDVDQAQAQKIARDQDAAEEAAFKKRSTELKGEIAAAKASGDALAQSIATAALQKLNALFKPGLAGAEKRADVADKAETKAIQSLRVDRKDTPNVQGSPLIQAVQAKLPGATEPPKISTITTPDGAVQKISSDAPKVSSITNAAGDKVLSQKTAAAPLITASSVRPNEEGDLVQTARTQPQPIARVTSPAAAEAKIDPALEAFFGPTVPVPASPITTAPTASAPIAAAESPAQEQNVAAIKETAQAIATTEAPAALDISPIKDGFGQYHQANLKAHTESKTAIGQQAQQIVDLAKDLAALKITVRNSAELAQATSS